MGMSISTQQATLSNACEIVLNLLTLQSARHSNGLLSTTEVACLMKSGGILDHCLTFMHNSKSSQTLKINCIRALTAAFTVMPQSLKIDFAESHKVIDVLCENLRPLSNQWKPQGCSKPAVKCLVTILKGLNFAGELPNDASTLIKSYAMECNAKDMVTLATELAGMANISLEESELESEDNES